MLDRVGPLHRRASARDPRWLTLGLLLWLAGTLAVAAAPVVVDVGADLRTLRLGDQLQVLEDPSRAMDLAAVQASPNFRRAPASGPKIGFSSSAWWIRLTLRNPGDRDRSLVLRESYPLMDSIEFWSPRADGRWQLRRTGDRLPFSSREYAHPEFLFALEVPAASTRTYYLRFASSGPMDVALSLSEPRALVGVIGEEQLVYGFYFGGFLVLVLYNFFLCLVVRDRAFYWYLLYAASFGTYFAVFNGLSFQYLWPDSPAWANQSVLVLLASTLVLGLQFARRFLESAANSPRLDAAARVLQVLCLAALAGAFLLPYSAMILALSALTVLATAMVLALGTLGLLEGYRPARYFMAAWAFLLLGVVLTMLKNFGWLPPNVVTQHGFQAGALCEMVLLSLALASRIGSIQRQSRIDALTRVYNRRFFDERVEWEFNRTGRTGVPFSLLVADIDHFKRFNDRFGHARGDEVLKNVARALLEGVRRHDTVCRYGGEEFALILPGTDGERARAVAEALRRDIERGAAGLSDPVTISVGVSSTDDRGIASVAELFRAADAALYAAKAAGRNRVMRHAPG